MNDADLRAMCERVLELNANTEKAPWKSRQISDSCFSHVLTELQEHVLIPDVPNEMSNLIAEYRSSCPDLARECLRLLKQCEAMRDVVEGSKAIISRFKYDSTEIGYGVRGLCYEYLRQALSKLETPPPAVDGGEE